MKKTLRLLLPLLLLGWGCRKNNPEPSQTQAIINAPPATGGLSLMITPAGAVKTLLLVSKSTNDSLYITPAATGRAQLGGLAPGDYVLHFNPATTYHLRSDSVISIKSATNTDFGNFSFTPVPVFTQFSFSNNEGNNFPASNVSATVNGANFLLTGSAGFTYRDGLGDDGEYCTLNIRLDNLSGPGTYVCKGTAASCITMNVLRQAGAPAGGTYSSTGSGGSATVVITSIDPVARTISGTFTATLISQSNPSGTKQTVKNGIFQLSYQ